jgi:hypothetical protein
MSRERVCDPLSAKKDIERFVFAQLSTTPYTLLTARELGQPLPEKIHLFGYRLHGEEHVLMQALFRDFD